MRALAAPFQPGKALKNPTSISLKPAHGSSSSSPRDSHGKPKTPRTTHIAMEPPEDGQVDFRNFTFPKLDKLTELEFDKVCICSFGRERANILFPTATATTITTTTTTTTTATTTTTDAF